MCVGVGQTSQPAHEGNDGHALAKDGESHHAESNGGHEITTGYGSRQAQRQGEGKGAAHAAPEEDMLMSRFDAQGRGRKERR